MEPALTVPLFTMDMINAINEPQLMVDLETMGVTTRAPIVAIAAVLFIPQTGEVLDKFYIKIDLTSSVQAGALLDPETVKFWLAQSDDARKEIWGTVGRNDDVFALDYALREFGQFIQRCQPRPNALKHWANGANFDPPILDAAYQSLGLRSPLAFWKSLDVRTIVELGRQIGINPKQELNPLGTPHKAMADCLMQCEYVSNIWQTLLAPHTRQYALPPRNTR